MNSVRHCALILSLLLVPAWLRADSVTPTIPPQPIALVKPAPETIDDLKAIQEQTKAVLRKVLPCTVGLVIGGAAGSGVIVSEDGIVLTAGHVSGDPNRDVRVILPDGKTVRGKTLGAFRTIDSGMVKITEKGPWPFVELGASGELKLGQWVLATGHPGGYRPGRSPVVRLGRVGLSLADRIRTDCTLVGGDSGGPLFDMQGKLIGIHSRISQQITENIHVPVDTYRETWERLVKAEVWGNGPGGRTVNPDEGYMGIECADENSCKISAVTAGSPADKAGLKPGDVIVRFDEVEVSNFVGLYYLIGRRKQGQDVPVDILRGSQEMTLKVKIGRRPAPQP